MPLIPSSCSEMRGENTTVTIHRGVAWRAGPSLQKPARMGQRANSVRLSGILLPMEEKKPYPRGAIGATAMKRVRAAKTPRVLVVDVGGTNINHENSGSFRRSYPFHSRCSNGSTRVWFFLLHGQENSRKPHRVRALAHPCGFLQRWACPPCYSPMNCNSGILSSHLAARGRNEWHLRHPYPCPRSTNSRERK